MGDSVPQIFDRALLRQRRARVAARFAEADFLRAHACAELAERLALVNRRFADAAIIGLTARHIAQAGFAAHIARYDIYNDPETPDGAWLEEESLDFAPQSRALIIFGWGLHLVNDLPGCLIQARRALRPDGLLLACLPGGETLSALRRALGEAEMAVTGGLAARIHPNSDIRDLGSLLQRAELALPVVDSETLTARYDTLTALMRDLRLMGEACALTRRCRTPLRRDVLAQAAALYAAQSASPDGRLLARFDLHYLLGWSPHADQPRPLRPGSAQRRLADALGSEEVPLADPPRRK